MVVSYNDIFNPLEGKKEQLIELFLSCWGRKAKYREKIINTINNIEFIFIDNSTGYETHTKIYEFYGKKKDEIAKQFFNEIKIEPVPFGIYSTLFEEIQQCLNNKEYDNYYFKKFIECMGFKGSVEDVLQQQDKYELIVGKIKQFEEVWNSKYKASCCELEEEEDKYSKVFEEERDRRIKIAREHNDNVINYLRNNENILCENDYELGVLEKSLRDLHSIGKEKLNDEFAVSYNKGRFIEAFKMFGYDYGNDYDRYINDQNLMDCVFDKDLVDYLYEQKKQKQVERMRSSSMFMSAVKQIEQLDIKGGNFRYIANIYSFSQGAMGRTAAYCDTYVNSKNELKHIIVLPLGIDLDTRIVIHEVGHAICSSFISADDAGFTYKMGYLTKSAEFSYKDFNDDEFFKAHRENPIVEDLEDKFSGRELDLSSEVWHEWVMKIISDYAIERGLTFGLGAISSAYWNGFPMIKAFAKKNGGLIAYSMIDDDPMMFVGRIGEDNYTKLAKAICISVILYDEVYDEGREYISKVGHKKMTMFEMAHVEHDWSPRMRKFLDAYLDAEEVFDSFYKSQQKS